MDKEFITNLLINEARKAQIDNIDGLDTKTFKKELKKELRKRFTLEDKILKAVTKLHNLNNKIKEIYNVPFDITEILEIIELLSGKREEN